MDTKSKNTDESVKHSIIIYAVLFLMALALVAAYPFIVKEVKNESSSSYFSKDSFVEMIYDVNYVLYKEAVDEKNGSISDTKEFFLSPADEDGDENISDETVERTLNTRFNDTKEKLHYAMENLQYDVKLDGEDIVKTNASSDLRKLDSDSIKEEYGLYLEMSFDKDGKCTINNIYGADSYEIKSEMDELQYKALDYMKCTSYKLNQIKDASFIYVVPKEIKYKDEISSILASTDRTIYKNASTKFLAAIAVMLLLFAVIMPYRISKNAAGFRHIAAIPFEINLIILISCVVFFAASPSYMIRSTVNGTVLSQLKDSLNESVFWIFAYGLNVIVYFVIFAIIFLNTVLIKHIFKSGCGTYFKTKSLFYKIFNVIKNSVQKVGRAAENMDLRNNQDKLIFKIVVCNLAIVVLLCCTWIFGAFGAIIYSAVLYKILQGYVRKMSGKYERLMEATNEISKGNLDIEIDENLGVFEPFKDEITNIQKGFKKAVDEEIKSQRMKTELISNVSHDLKTPLTSIITYVDLLKNDDLTDEERRAYIDTLDRKSQRLKSLIEDLFEVTKATTGNIKLNIMTVDIVSLLKEVQLELYDKIEASTLTFKQHYPEGKVMLKLDSQRTFRIFENLIVNAIKYSMKNSRVYISVEDMADDVTITIKNISAAEMNFDVDEIADRFVRGDKSRNTEGSGLGLAIAKTFTELQGGTFRIEVDGDLFKAIVKFKKDKISLQSEE